jgi:hypothetical protein
MDQPWPCGADDDADDGDAAAIDERPHEFGAEERRMHVRAYNFWVSLLRGRAYPALADLEPDGTAEFDGHAVLLDFTRGGDAPEVVRVGERLAGECGIDGTIRSLAGVSTRSLLGRLTRQYRDILVNRAPIAFEAEFIDDRGSAMLYRGILLPFSSDDDHIDFVYGVINWKALADAVEAERLAAAAGIAAIPPAMIGVADGAAPAAWAEGPSALDVDSTLAERLESARAGARSAERAEIDARAALHRALALAHDLLVDAERDPDGFADILADAGCVGATLPPAIVSLVFGDAPGEARLREFADVLANARRIRLPRGGFARHVEGLRGGIRAMIVAERERREAGARARARSLPVAAAMPEVEGDEEFVLLVARRQASGRLGVVAAVPDDSVLIDRAIGRITP